VATIIQTKSGKWKAIIRRPGFGVALKVKTFAKKADAEGWGRKIESEIERAVWRDVGEAERMTLGEALKKYERDRTERHRGKEAEKAHIRVLQSEPIMRNVLARIDRGNMRALRDRWVSDGYAVATVNRRLTILHAVFEFAREDLKMPSLENPVAGLKLKGANERERRVSEEEIKEILRVSKSPALATFVRVATETAIRRGELCKLEWPMLDLKQNVAHLPGRITKNGKPRDVPLSTLASKFLKAQGNGKGRVLPLRPHSVTQAMTRAVERGREQYVARCSIKGDEPDPAFLLDLHFHDLRHEATSRLAELFNLQELMKITGESDAKMLMRYYHPRAEDFAKRMRAPWRNTQPAAKRGQKRRARAK